MDMESIPAALLIGLGLSFLTQAIVVLVENILGEFKFGSLEKSIDFTIYADKIEEFKESFYKKIEELGFVQTQSIGISEIFFLQGQGPEGGPVGTHAGTKKELKIKFDEGQSNKYTVTLTLKYLDPIVADTGESAYRDAVLNYLSGLEREMIIVPNVSYFGVCCFAGSLIVSIAMGIDYFGHVKLLNDYSILFYCLLSIALGIMAIISFLSKPKEIKGIGMSILGTLVNAVWFVLIGLKLYIAG